MEGQFFIEEEILVEINGYLLKGFIDIYFKNNNEIVILDYKTSSKFAKRDLIPNGRQLVLYAIALEQMYPDCKVVAIGWDMLKYVEVQGTRGPKLIERRDLSGEDYKEALVYHTFNEETKIFAFWDKSSRNYSNDLYIVPAGEVDYNLYGQAKYNPGNGNAFRFDNNNNQLALSNRKKSNSKGIIVTIIAVIINTIPANKM